MARGRAKKKGRGRAAKAGASGRTTAAGKATATVRKVRPRKSYTPRRRATILAIAGRERLTAPQIQKRFGVKPVTYYSWRRKAKHPGTKAGRRVGVVGKGSGVTREVRLELQARIRKLLPEIVLSEVQAWLAKALRG